MNFAASTRVEIQQMENAMKNTPGSIKSALLAVPALALSSALMLPCANAA
ncbi:MAG: hypothetical protein ACR2FI_02665 [Burkholderiales bacterium]